MTQLNKSALTLLFQQGDVPSGTDYANLIDSYVNQAETGVQTMQGPLSTTELVTPRVSATDLNVTNATNFGSLITAPTVSANLVITNDVSANGTVYASAIRSPLMYGSIATISAAGTTQATAAQLTATICTLRGVTDGTTTGFTPIANRQGWVQQILNDGPSANLWPPTGGRINGLAVNTAFSLATSTAYTITHFSASAMGCK
jgi:hypothetical protein